MAKRSPTSEFLAQEISLDLSKYDGVLVVAKALNTSNSMATMEIFKNISGVLNIVSSVNFYRNFYVADDGINVADGYYVLTYNTPTKNNNAIIPYKIYGIKGVR